MKNTNTFNTSLVEVEKLCYSPILYLYGDSFPLENTYLFLSYIDEYASPAIPDQPELKTTKETKDLFKNIFFIKKVTSDNISPVIPRINWTSGEIYDEYRDDYDIFELDANGILTKRFYVKNSFDQVFKCLFNNHQAYVSDEPILSIASFRDSNKIVETSDGYRWKYIYTLNSGSKQKFMNKDWMPIPLQIENKDAANTSAGIGQIDCINVLGGGSNYYDGTQTTIVTISGDGAGANAVAYVVSNVVSSIVMTNTGKDYSYATVDIVAKYPYTGSGANLSISISPIGGHAFDLLSEFSVNHAMITLELEGTESDNLPQDMTFRQMGLINNPLENTLTGIQRATGTSYSTTHDVIMSIGFNDYISGEYVYQGTYTSPTFLGRAVYFETTTNTLKMLPIRGTLAVNTILYGHDSETARIVLQESLPSIIKNSGHITYIENRETVERIANNIEKFNLIVRY